MTYEEALQIAIEELYDTVEYLKAMNKGFPRVEAQCNELMEAHDLLRKKLEDADKSYDQTALELCERCGWKTLVPDDGCLNCNRREWVGLTDEEVGTLTVFDGLHDVETPLLADFARFIEAKLKEKNTP